MDKTTGNKHPSHRNGGLTNYILPGRMNLVAGKIVNQGALDWEGAETSELCKAMGEKKEKEGRRKVCG